VARIQIAASYSAGALKEIQFVADRWRGPDRNEAIELWHQVPGTPVPSEEIQVTLNPADLKDPKALANAIPKTANGTVVSIDCSDKHKVVLQTANGPQTFTSDGRVQIGYSDTFWWAGDHFSVCHQAPGLRAVLRYKANTAKGDSLGDWTALELRDDLPTPPSTAANPASGTAAPVAPESAKPAESNPTPPPPTPKS